MADYSLSGMYAQQPRPYSFANWNTPIAVPGTAGAPVVMTGADWEQMPMGTNGLAPNQGMFTGSAVNAPLSGPTGFAGAGTTPGWLQSMRDWGVLGSTDKNGLQQQGWGGLALGAAQGIGSLYLGLKQYELAKDTLANNKAQFERNFAAQKATTNASLEDRQRARVASNAGAYQSVGDYMAQNGVR